MVGYVILLLVGLAMCVIGTHNWIANRAIGLYDSTIITLGFSFLVVGMDELIHMRRHRLRERQGAARVGH